MRQSNRRPVDAVETADAARVRLGLVIASLGAGGAEKIASLLASHWAAKGWEVTILTFDHDGHTPFYALHPAVRLRALGIMGASRGVIDACANNVRRIRTLRAAIREGRLDILLSFVDRTNVTSLLASRGLGVPLIAAERTDPKYAPIGRVWNALRRLTYPWSQRIVVQSEGAAAYFGRADDHRLAIIPNPVPPVPESATRHRVRLKRPAILSIGRLSEEKRFDLLIEAFARVAASQPECTLTVCGEGPERARLQALCDRLGLTHRVDFPGSIPEAHEVLKDADLFVLSSRFEGFPNALCEAMAAGVPVIATDCPSGPRVIVRHGIDGLLVPNGDVDALAGAIDRLMSDPESRRRLGQRAKEVTTRFATDKVVAMWEAVLEDAMRKARK